MFRANGYDRNLTGFNRLAANPLRRTGLVALALGLLFASMLSACAAIDPYLPSFLQAPSSGDPVPVRTIAVLPFAYRGPSDRFDCDVCPNPLVLSETSAETALLITAFFYEGQIIEWGKTVDLFMRPKHSRTEEYVTGRFG